jgi:hypothetical protein
MKISGLDFGRDLPLDRLAIAELDVVLMEKCGILAPEFFDQPVAWPTSFGELDDRSHLEQETLIARLTRSAELSQDILFESNLSALKIFAAGDGNLILICDLIENPKIMQSFPKALSTDRLDWTEIYSAIEAATRIVCLCKDGKRSFSTALGIRERCRKPAQYCRGGFLQLR